MEYGIVWYGYGSWIGLDGGGGGKKNQFQYSCHVHVVSCRVVSVGGRSSLVIVRKKRCEYYKSLALFSTVGILFFTRIFFAGGHFINGTFHQVANFCVFPAFRHHLYTIRGRRS